MADFGCVELLEEAYAEKMYPPNKEAGTLWYNPPDVSVMPASLILWDKYCLIGTNTV